jgi:hypothetical protein
VTMMAFGLSQTSESHATLIRGESRPSLTPTPPKRQEGTLVKAPPRTRHRHLFGRHSDECKRWRGPLLFLLIQVALCNTILLCTYHSPITHHQSWPLPASSARSSRVQFAQALVETPPTWLTHYRRDPLDETLRKRQGLCFPRHQPSKLRPRC